MDAITDIRNEIEHYYTTFGQDAVRGIISKSFLLFRDFVRNELSEDPRELLGKDSWTQMTDISEVYERERKECEQAIGVFLWTCSALQEAVMGTTCLECASALIEPFGDSRACYELFVKREDSIRVVKATQCRPAKVEARRS